jgi:flagellar basal-body rod protein FlgC
MDFFTALEVSGSGLSAERTRVNLASSNLANAETTRDANGAVYRRLDPVFEAVHLQGSGGPGGGTADPAAVRVAQVVADPTAGRKVYSPGHPDADADGFVIFPNVNPVYEVVNLLSASRGYDANASAIETIKVMAQKGLDITR